MPVKILTKNITAPPAIEDLLELVRQFETQFEQMKDEIDGLKKQIEAQEKELLLSNFHQKANFGETLEAAQESLASALVHFQSCGGKIEAEFSTSHTDVKRLDIKKRGTRYRIYSPLPLTEVDLDMSKSHDSGPISVTRIPIMELQADPKDIVSQLKAAEGGAYSFDDLAGQWRISSQALYNWRRRFQVIYWQDAQARFFYPKWQFGTNGRVLPSIAKILAIFRSDDVLRLLDYFLQPKVSLDGKRPLDLIRDGKANEVILHAKSAANDCRW